MCVCVCVCGVCVCACVCVCVCVYYSMHLICGVCVHVHVLCTRIGAIFIHHLWFSMCCSSEVGLGWISTLMPSSTHTHTHTVGGFCAIGCHWMCSPQVHQGSFLKHFCAVVLR